MKEIEIAANEAAENHAKLQEELSLGNIDDVDLRTNKANFILGFLAGAKSQSMSEWVSVETPPKDNTMVLVWQHNLSDEESSRCQKANYLSAGVFTIYPMAHSTIYKSSNGYKNYDLEGDMCQITHWQPLPPPPQTSK